MLTPFFRTTRLSAPGSVLVGTQYTLGKWRNSLEGILLFHYINMQRGEAYWHSYAFPHIHYERVWMSECQALRLMLEIQWWGAEIVQAGLLSLSPSGGDGHYGDNRTGKWESMTGARDERMWRETDCAQGWQNNSGMPHLTCQLDCA